LGRSSGVCTCLYYNIVHGAVRLPTYFRRPTQFHRTKPSRSCMHQRVAVRVVLWSRRLRPPFGSFGSSARTHSHNTVALTHRHALSQALSCSPVSYSAKHTNTHTHTKTRPTHTTADRVCARRKTRTKTDNVDARARYPTRDVKFLDERTTGVGNSRENEIRKLLT